MIAYELITGQSQQIQGGIFKIMQNVIDGKRPDCSMIKNKKIKTFLEACWSGNPDQRPNFDQILKTICDIDFCSAFSVNFEEVQNYLLRFPSDNKMLNKFIMQLSNEKLKNIPPGTKFNVYLIGSTFSGKTALVNTYLKNKNYSCATNIVPDYDRKTVHFDHGDIELLF